MDTLEISSELDVTADETTTSLPSLCSQLEAYEKLSHEELVRICNNLETTIQLKDKEIDRINKHTEHILGMYYDVENKLAERNGELVSCQAGLKEVQDALSQWRRELATSSLSTDSSRYHPSSTPEISSGTGSSEGDYRMSTHRDVEMDESGEASGIKGDDITSKHDRRQSGRKSTSLGKNMQPVLHRRQRNGNNNNNGSSYDLDRPLRRADLKSPRRPDAAEHTQDTKRLHRPRPQPLPKPVFHSVNGPLRVLYDDHQMSPHGNILSRSMALSATEATYDDGDTGQQMSFYRKAYNVYEEGTHLSVRKPEAGHHKLNGINLHESNKVTVADANNLKNAVNGNGRHSSLGGIDDNNSEMSTRSKVEPTALSEDHPTVKTSTVSDLIDTEKYQFNEEAFVHDIIEALIRRVCYADHLE